MQGSTSMSGAPADLRDRIEVDRSDDVAIIDGRRHSFADGALDILSLLLDPFSRRSLAELSRLLGLSPRQVRRCLTNLAERVEAMRPTRHGRPALVMVDSKAVRLTVLRSAAADASGRAPLDPTQRLRFGTASISRWTGELWHEDKPVALKGPERACLARLVANPWHAVVIDDVVGRRGRRVTMAALQSTIAWASGGAAAIEGWRGLREDDRLGATLGWALVPQVVPAGPPGTELLAALPGGSRESAAALLTLLGQAARYRAVHGGGSQRVELHRAHAPYAGTWRVIPCRPGVAEITLVQSDLRLSAFFDPEFPSTGSWRRIATGEEGT